MKDFTWLIILVGGVVFMWIVATIALYKFGPPFLSYKTTGERLGQLYSEYQPRFVDGQWKSGFEVQGQQEIEKTERSPNTIGAILKDIPTIEDLSDNDYINLWGEPHRWNPDKKELESVDE